VAQPTQTDEHLYAELWVSLASLLRSYTAAHGLNGNRQATVELGEEKIIVRHAENWLALVREGAQVGWTRENGSGGTMHLTEHGRLRATSPKDAAASQAAASPQKDQEEDLDMAAEAWARDLMRESQL